MNPDKPAKEAVVQANVPHKINPNKRINIATMRNKQEIQFSNNNTNRNSHNPDFTDHLLSPKKSRNSSNNHRDMLTSAKSEQI